MNAIIDDEIYQLACVSYCSSMLCESKLFVAVNKASTSFAFFLVNPSKGPTDLHIECIVETAVFVLMLLILMVTVSEACVGQIGRQIPVAVVPLTEVVLLLDSVIFWHQHKH